MLRYKLHEETDDTVIYEYSPEGKYSPGLVGISKATGELNLIKLAENDEIKWYVSKLYRKLEEFQKNCYRKEGMIAWY